MFASSVLHLPQVYPDNVGMDIGLVIRRERKQRGINQESLADAIGYATSNLSRVERGLQGVTVEQLQAAGRLLGIPAWKLLWMAEVGGDEPPEPSAASFSPRAIEIARVYDSVGEPVNAPIMDAASAAMDKHIQQVESIRESLDAVTGQQGEARENAREAEPGGTS